MPAIKAHFVSQEMGINDREARSRSITAVAVAVAAQIEDQLKNRTDLGAGIDEASYVIKFATFTDRQMEKIRESMLELSAGKKAYCSIETTNSSPGLVEYHIKWNKKGHAQENIISIISEFCEEQGINVDSNKSTKGVIYFEPGRKLRE
jgi:hypothetical protein